jgi:hypothetical protein
MRIAKVLGILAFSIKFTTGFNKKYKKMEIRNGKNNVEINVNNGSKIKDSFVQTNKMITIMRISNVQKCNLDLNNATNVSSPKNTSEQIAKK